MDHWYEQRNEAIETYHAQQPAQALKMFEELWQETTDLEKAADLLLWKANCHRALKQFDEAIEMVDNLEAEGSKLTTALLTRKQHLKADIAADTGDFEEALRIYRELTESVQSYDDLYYLDMRIYELLSDFEAFQQFGSIDDWKKKILGKLHKALEFFSKSK